MINNGGGECYPYVCDFCGSRSPIVEKKEQAEQPTTQPVFNKAYNVDISNKLVGEE